MGTKSIAVLILLSAALPASAKPITLSCTIEGPTSSIYGRLSVIVDPKARWVLVEAEKMPGIQWRYSNGKVAPILTQAPEWMLKTPAPATTPLTQFVNVTPQWVTFGARDSDGDLVEAGTFNRSALSKPKAPCVWRLYIKFGLG